MKSDIDLQIRLIPVDQINVLNPRGRGKKKFAEIAHNIEKVGLKRPVTVAPAEPKNGNPMYDLVCGQGRLEAYIALGESEIPALVIRGTREDLLLMSLAENIARRQHTTIELMRNPRAQGSRIYLCRDCRQDRLGRHVRERNPDTIGKRRRTASASRTEGAHSRKHRHYNCNVR